jgi:chemosensory pili system protein ChpA (sensor histidine kinase/response regulator)
MDTAADFDLGPLSWVQGEIDQALSRGLDALAVYRDKPDDAASLKHARMHIHQAAGAIQMVGLDAVVAFTDEIERQLTRLEELPADARAPTLAALDRGCRKLRIFLDELANGAPPVPLKLFPEYEAMQVARGIKAAAPTDLFYPDLGPRAPRIAPREIVPANKLPSHLIKQRRHYQRGLLAWLRGDDDGGRAMRDAIAGIEDITTQSSLRAFWWTVGALLEALVEKGLEPGFGVKQLAARVDLQIRRVAEGSAKVADRLRREVLYYVAIAAPVAPQVQAVQRAFRLSGLIPSAEVLSADVVRIQPLLREAREQLAGAKDAWLKAASGRAENLPKLKQTLASVHNKAAEIKHGALMKLTAALVERLDRMPGSGVSEPLAMEYATALLLAESAFENYASLSAEFPAQVDAMLARLDAARSGRPAAASAPMLDEMGKRAQERVLLAQVGREIQANLRHMEQVLDAFFRDHGKRADLASLSKDSSQIRGALHMLGLDDAVQLLELCQQQIDGYADPEAPVADDDLELLAESLSGLGFYVEAVEQQRPDRDRLIAPLLAKRLGETPAPQAAPADSVETAVAELRAALPELVAEAQRAPADAAMREGLRQKLAGLRDDAELIGDADLVAQADAALKGLDSGGTDALAAAVEQIADTGAAPAPAISEETQRLLATDASQLDAELLEIYLTEAAEVLDTVGAQRAALERNAGDREALGVVRRQFHTLKGSGRMVGLTQLGDIAYGVERVHNRLLEEDRPVTAAVVAMIAVAERDFRTWVDALQATRRVVADPAPIEAAVRAVENELDGGARAPAAKPTMVAASPAPAPRGTSAPGHGPEASASASAPEMVASPQHGVAPSARPFGLALAPEAADAGAVHAGAAPAPSLPVVEMIELPELGAALAVGPTVTIEESAFGETIDVTPPLHDGAKPVLRVVADNTQPAPYVAPARTQVLSLADTAVAFDRASRSAGEPSTAASPRAEEEPAEPEPEDVVVGQVTLSSSLWKILCDEADGHLRVLGHELTLLQFDSQYVPSESMVRASHTLCGIHRTGGFPLIAATAKALEQALLALQQHGAPLPGSAQPVLARAIAGLADFVARVRARFGFMSAHEQEGAEIQRELEALRQDAMTAAPPVDAEAIAAAQAEQDDDGSPRDEHGAAAAQSGSGVQSGVLAAGSDDAGTPHASQSSVVALHPLADPVLPLPVEPAHDPLIDLHDEVDDTVLSIFLEEAGELFPQAGEQVRAWRRTPGDASAAQQLRRTLHTFKGSARMAGAMRLGELTHRMESRLMDGDSLAEPTPELFEALDTDLDHVAFVLDALRSGRTNVALPWLAVAATTAAQHAVDIVSPTTALESSSSEAGSSTAASFAPPSSAALSAASSAAESAAESVGADSPEVPPSHAPAGAAATVATATAATATPPVTSPAGASLEPSPSDRAASEALAPDAQPVDSPAAAAATPVMSPEGAADTPATRVANADPDSPRVSADDTRGAAPPEADRPIVVSRAPSTIVPGPAPATAAPGAGSAPSATNASSVPSTPAPRWPTVPSTPAALPSPAPAATAPRPRAGTARADGPEVDAGARAMLRVRADIVDRLVNEAGEVAIARARVEGELRALKANLLELTGSVIRLRSQVREIELQSETQIQSRMSSLSTASEEFDPLELDRYTRFQELTRSLAEGVNDVSTVQLSLLRNLDDADAALLAQARLSREVQQRLFAIRTVPFGSLSERLYRIMRTTARELDKRANLEIHGAQTELDRSVLEKLAGPLEHLLRNSIDHGLESREGRRKAGKAETGEISLTVKQVGNEILIELADVGAGIDLARVRERARSAGLIPQDGEPTAQQLIECLFQPGFSTATKVTQISGRGIGMDVVRSEIVALGGRVEVQTESGKGSQFNLYLPLTLAVAQAVLVRAGGRLWALPAPMVEQVQQVKGDALLKLYVARVVEWQGRSYPFHYLPRLLGDTAHNPETVRYNAVLLVRGGQGYAAIHVDEMVGNQEVVVKNIGPQLARVSGISGATVLGTGEIVLIINPVQLAQRADVPAYDPEAEGRVASAPAKSARDSRPLVMIVDDSLTVRKITSRLLAREGFDVVSAKDGMDALQVLTEQTPDVILLDIEMPRMDGFEFTKTIKADARNAHIPIIMITSRTAEKHRNRAAELGVDLYLGKPYQEDELLRHLREMLSIAAPA